jgi:hypothetical protein
MADIESMAGLVGLKKSSVTGDPANNPTAYDADLAYAGNKVLQVRAIKEAMSRDPNAQLSDYGKTVINTQMPAIFRNLMEKGKFHSEPDILHDEFQYWKDFSKGLDEKIAYFDERGVKPPKILVEDKTNVENRMSNLIIKLDEATQKYGAPRPGRY